MTMTSTTRDDIFYLQSRQHDSCHAATRSKDLNDRPWRTSPYLASWTTRRLHRSILSSQRIPPMRVPFDARHHGGVQQLNEGYEFQQVTSSRV
jgi:hypothetical protein